MTQKFKAKHCYLCKSPDMLIRKGLVRDSPDSIIYECSNCGLVQLSVDHARIHHGFYENSGMHGDNPRPISEWLNATEWDDQRRFEYLKNLLPNKKLLDFGCGAGGFLLKAKPITEAVNGIELEKRVIKHWSETLKIYDSIESVHMAESTTGEHGNESWQGYDLITAFHVVEHLPDPRALLKSISSLLKPNGQLIIEVPNADDALLTLYDCRRFQEFTYWSQHLYLFTSRTLEILLKQAGLKALSIKHIQRYPLSNHMHWLSRGLPGGHNNWNFLDTPQLMAEYSKSLASIGKTDTLIAHITKEPSA